MRKELGQAAVVAFFRGEFERIIIEERKNITYQATRISCHLDTHGDKLAGRYLTAVLRVRNVPAFSIQLCWRAAARAGSPVVLKKDNKRNFKIREKRKNKVHKGKRKKENTQHGLHKNITKSFEMFRILESFQILNQRTFCKLFLQGSGQISRILPDYRQIEYILQTLEKKPIAREKKKF